MTAVLFKFSNPDGTPVADAPFLITTRKASFDEALDNGIQVPGDINAVTDAQGEATVTLLAGFATYYLFMDRPGAEPDSNDCVAGLRYRFVVTDSATPIRVEDLIVTTPTWSRPWDETALQIIIDAKLAAQASADAAEISQGLAEASAVRAEEAEAVTVVNADAAAASALAAGQSEIAAHADMLTTEGYRTEAEASKNAAAASAAASAASADFASGAVVDMQAQVDEATLQATNAGVSAGQSAASALAAAGSETAALGAASATAADVVTTTANKEATAADVITVTGLKGDVTALKDETMGYRDQAITAVGSLGAIIVNGGPVDLSGGVYPAAPEYSTLWKVTVGGTVAGAQGDTYGVGDTLMYAAQQALFYKIDNTESVSEVNGQTGAVTLGKADVGLPNVDNTADIDKPLSTAAISANTAQNVAVADGLALKVAIADIINNLASTETDKPLSAAQGKLLYDLVQSNNATIVRYTYALAPGQTVVSGNDLNGVPLSYVPGTAMLVELNGFLIWLTNDYTATDGSSLVLTAGVEAASEMAITVFGSFSVANHYTKAEDDAKFVQKVSVIDVAHGGTGGTTQQTARTSLGLGNAATANVVGTVSQEGGISTGAIIESGSNSNGQYVKYADGTMICSHIVRMNSVLTSDILGGTWTFPMPFEGVEHPPHVTHTPLQGSSNDCAPTLSERFGPVVTPPSNSGISLRSIRRSGATAFVAGNFIDTHVWAKGRWY